MTEQARSSRDLSLQWLQTHRWRALCSRSTGVVAIHLIAQR